MLVLVLNKQTTTNINSIDGCEEMNMNGYIWNWNLYSCNLTPVNVGTLDQCVPPPRRRCFSLPGALYMSSLSVL